MQPGEQRRQFPTTRWTLILSARRDPAICRAALDELLSLYWKPLYFFARHRGLDVEAAQDAVQDFLAHLLERNVIERLDPERGRFRSYLRTAFGHQLINRHEREVAQKRGGGIATVDFAALEDRLGDGSGSAEAAFDREWALDVMERALAELRREFDSGARRGPFDVVVQFFRGEDAPPYTVVAAAHGMTVPQLKAFLHRARVRFRALVRQTVGETVSDPSEIDAEVGDLLRALRA